MAKAHSSRKRFGRRTPVNSAKPNPEPQPGGKDTVERPPNIRDALGRFSEALALLEAGYNAVGVSQEDESLRSAGVVTLKRGLDELNQVYIEIDVAIPWAGGNSAT